MTTTFRFIGTANYAPAPGEETACCLVNEMILLDCGWDAGTHMRRFGCQPSQLEYLLVTHCHFDHVYGMPQLLMWRRCQPNSHPRRPLVVVGPSPDIESAVERAIAFLRADPWLKPDWPVQVIGLAAGDTLEREAFVLHTCRAVHEPTALCYRLGDRSTGRVITFTGDTAYSPEIVDLARASDVLMHEAASGPDEYHDPSISPGHSGALDAARAAQEAGVRRLYLMHCDEPALSQSVEVARRLFAETYVPRQGELVALV